MEFDMVAYKDLAKLADMVAGHGGWLIGLKLFWPKPYPPTCVSSKLCEFILNYNYNNNWWYHDWITTGTMIHNDDAMSHHHHQRKLNLEVQSKERMWLTEYFEAKTFRISAEPWWWWWWLWDSLCVCSPRTIEDSIHLRSGNWGRGESFNRWSMMKMIWYQRPWMNFYSRTRSLGARWAPTSRPPAWTPGPTKTPGPEKHFTENF